MKPRGNKVILEFILRGENVSHKTLENMWIMAEDQDRKLRDDIWDGERNLDAIFGKLSEVTEVSSDLEFSSGSLKNSNLVCY